MRIDWRRAPWIVQTRRYLPRRRSVRAKLPDRCVRERKGELLDAVALAQVTPGPVVQTVAVVGFAAAGVGGGLLAAAVAFGPSLSFILLGAERFDGLRSARPAGAFLDGGRPSSDRRHPRRRDPPRSRSQGRLAGGRPGRRGGRAARGPARGLSAVGPIGAAEHPGLSSRDYAVPD
jgi:hypothetical protein